MAQTLVLADGELHHQRRFGPGTVNRGALLLDCEWDGGVFESGALVSGVFRSGEVRGGTVLGALFWDGEWTGGSWERGFDRQGRYRPRTDRPPHSTGPPPARRTRTDTDEHGHTDKDRPCRSVERPCPSGGRGAPALTVFTSTVYADVARLWLACVRRAFPEAVVEIFWDSDRPPPDAGLLPGARLLLRSPARRDYHEAYDDALARCSTPYLAITDTDVFWTSRDLWPRLRDELEGDDRLAAISCVSRRGRPSHGTFAAVLKADVYRRVLAERRTGFAPAITEIDPEVPWQRWTFHSSGDLATRAVLDAGWEVRLLHLDEAGQELVRFDGITAPRRVAEHLPGPARLVTVGRYHWSGMMGNRILAGLHDRLFPAGPAYGLDVPAIGLVREALRRGPREAARRFRLFSRSLAGGRRVESFLGGAS